MAQPANGRHLLHLCGALSVISLVLTFSVPAVSLTCTPGDALQYSGVLEGNLQHNVTTVTRLFWSIPKPVWLLLWLLLTSAQFAGTLVLRPTLGLALAQLILAISTVVLFVFVHLLVVHVPYIMNWHSLN